MRSSTRTKKLCQGPWCQYCNSFRSSRRFDKHVEACKRHHNELATAPSFQVNKSRPQDDLPVPQKRRKLDSNSSPDFTFNKTAYGEDQAQIDEAEPSHQESSLDLDSEVHNERPSSFIQVIPHPHSGIKEPTIISLDTPTTYSTFNYAETAVKGLFSKDIINTQLRGIHGGWARETAITLQSHVDLEHSLKKARKLCPQFREGNVSAVYLGETFHFSFVYRDPWEVYCDWIMDASLSSMIFWYPCKKFFCRRNGRVTLKTRIYDEFSTGNRWWDIQDQLPKDDIPHCFLPVSLWLDKGNVTKRVRKHPMIIRPAFLPREVRNASGNGGGVLIGYMPVPEDPADPTDRNSAETLEWAHFKRDVYHQVLGIVFKTLQRPARHGEAMKCGDSHNRIIHPGIPIKSLDGEESCVVTAMWAALANYPCPKCLVHHNELHNINGTFEPRITKTMQKAYLDSTRAPNKSEAERILQSRGLHATQNFFWSLHYLDPYLLVSYDKLHSDDLGKWGKHLWPLLLSVLAEDGVKGQLARNMRNVSRWRNLKHFGNVTTVDYADGQDVSRDYGKSFDFFKQHFVNHVIEDIQQKGATDNYETRVGEGIHQEVRQAYKQTNCKNTDPQMARIDENQESIAYLRMVVDEYDKAQQEQEQVGNAREAETEDTTEQAETEDTREHIIESTDDHWTLGSPTSLSDSIAMETMHSAFDKSLRRFFSIDVPDASLGVEPIKIRQYHCVYLRYQLQEDWTEGRDILRCNPRFNGVPRHDCILINTDTVKPTPARLIGIYRCYIKSKTYDVVLVNYFKPSTTKPRTKWAGARLYEEARESRFALVKYFIRGAHMITAFGMREGRFYLNDTVDGDMFLHFSNDSYCII
ncbi:hypothetical protein SERLADRAFT_433403 [Serpula lacrymans var. lacrymans S7.9]|uniref:Uncharacterized protein n=1 Tax=Serpula lacrymans var. lacrymans (strain S7.9) TaxID=578457 RepID=F8NGU2_SERL9|nr:uncharacterized protein SERLADRAFT_433403 [Serpula lacrymans var. lacrymans S7.9]EGO29424.1 hypothetical protein SERLADRAFT_433403 [Serpula lacrymans var. lacrymans S7.9]